MICLQHTSSASSSCSWWVALFRALWVWFGAKSLARTRSAVACCATYYLAVAFRYAACRAFATEVDRYVRACFSMTIWLDVLYYRPREVSILQAILRVNHWRRSLKKALSTRMVGFMTRVWWYLMRWMHKRMAQPLWRVRSHAGCAFWRFVAADLWIIRKPSDHRAYCVLVWWNVNAAGLHERWTATNALNLTVIDCRIRQSVLKKIFDHPYAYIFQLFWSSGLFTIHINDFSALIGTTEIFMIITVVISAGFRNWTMLRYDRMLMWWMVFYQRRCDHQLLLMLVLAIARGQSWQSAT